MKIQIWPLALLALSSCGSKPTGQLPAVRLATTQNAAVYSPILLAESLGFWRDEGLAVTVLELAGNSKSMEALLGGSTDVVAGYYEQTIQMAEKARRICSFVLIQRSPGLILVASPRGRKKIGKIEDLKGAIVSVNALGSAKHFFLNLIMAQHVIDAKNVGVVAVPIGTAELGAVERGTVDAAVLGGSYFAIRNRIPGIKTLADGSTLEGIRQTFGMAGYPSASLMADAAWLERNPDTAARMARATLHAMRWMREHSPQEVLDKLPANLRMDDAEADRQTVARAISTLSPDGMISNEEAAGVKKVLSISLEEVRNANLDLSKTYTNQYVTAK